MKNPIYLLLVFMLFLISCDDDGPNILDDVADVEIVFKAMFGDDPYIVNQTYDYGDDQIKIATFSFYVSDIKLGSSSNASEVEEIDFVDFSGVQVDQQSAEAGIRIVSSEAPIGNYPAMSIGIGVPSDLNKTSPDEYAPTHVLSKTSHYWADWQSYIHMKIEGTLDTDGDGLFDDVSFMYHVGADETYESLEIQTPVTIVKDEMNSILVEVDLEKLFVSATRLDIEAKPRLHTAEDLTVGHFLMDNFSNAVRLQ
ncbi:MAG: hypothetical protein KJP00_04795 [Bacteroidia bacterium]|nr:hypothetical protein [Bacteroidia bacterium]